MRGDTGREELAEPDVRDVGEIDVVEEGVSISSEIIVRGEVVDAESLLRVLFAMSLCWL